MSALAVNPDAFGSAEATTWLREQLSSPECAFKDELVSFLQREIRPEGGLDGSLKARILVVATDGLANGEVLHKTVCDNVVPDIDNEDIVTAIHDDLENDQGRLHAIFEK